MRDDWGRVVQNCAKLRDVICGRPLKEDSQNPTFYVGLSASSSDGKLFWLIFNFDNQSLILSTSEEVQGGTKVLVCFDVDLLPFE